MPALVKARFVTDWHAPNVEQAALAAFMAEGGFARHVRRMRKVYRDRHHGVRLYSLGDFGVGERRHGLVFGYGAVAAERIEPGLARLRSLADGGTA